MKILFRKKILYSILGIVVIVVICMQSPFRVVNGVEFSIWAAIWKLPRDVLNTCTVQSAFDSGVSSWIYILMPMIVSIPSASCIMDEIQSNFYLYIEGRKGKDRYVCSRFFQNIISAGSMTLLGLGIYIIIITMIFLLNPVYKDIETIGLNILVR